MLKPACPVCEARKVAFLCQDCINSQLYDDKRREHQEQRDELQQELEAALEKRAAWQQQQLQLWRLRRRVEAARNTQAAAERELKQELEWQQGLRASVERRRAAAEAALQELAAARAKALGSALPTQIRYQSLTLSHVSAMLAREQRMHMRALLEIFPLRINALRAATTGAGGVGGGGPIQITMCNLRLPESLVAPAGGWQDPLGVSAALGYLLQLVDKVAFIMGGPLLHEALFQGSTSSIWVPSSFWDRQPRRQDHVLPLFVPGVGGGGPSGVNTASSAQGASGGTHASGGAGGGGYGRQGGGGYGGFWQMALGRQQVASHDSGSGHALLRTLSDTSTSSGGAPRALGGLLSSRREADAQAAFALLQRSLACFLRDKAASSSLQLPAAWNPLAWLVVFCAVVKRDAKADGKLVAASLAADAAASTGSSPTPGSAAAGAAAAGGSSGRGLEFSGSRGSRGAPSRGSRDSLDSGSVMALLDGAGDQQQQDGALPLLPEPPLPWGGAWALEGDDDDEEDEGWGVVRAPFLPPPPSRPDDVEHWTRAMITDNLGVVGGGGGGGGAPVGMLASSPGNGGMLSVEYIRQLFM